MYTQGGNICGMRVDASLAFDLPDYESRWSEGEKNSVSPLGSAKSYTDREYFFNGYGIVCCVHTYNDVIYTSVCR